MISKTEISNTPFEIITSEEGNFLAIGKYRLTTTYKEKDEILEIIENKSWDLIINLINATIHAHNREKELNNLPETGA